MSRWRRLLPFAFAGLLAWLVGYPLLLTALDSLRADGAGEWGLANFRAFEGGCTAEMAAQFTAEGFSGALGAFSHGIGCSSVRPLWNSLWISLATVLFSAAIGIPLAFLFERADFPGRRLLGSLVALPVALPPLVGTIAFLFLYGETGLATRAVQTVLGLGSAPWRLTGPPAILAVHTYSMYVYFYLFTRAGLARLDAALPEAAASLGASPGRTFRRVTVPLLAPALVGAALLTFMTSLASFSAPYLFGGTFRVMTTEIVAAKLNGQLGIAQVETVALAVLALAALFSMRRFDRRTRLTGTVRGVAPRPRTLAHPAARWGASVLGYGLAAFLVLPHLTLLVMSFVPPRSWTTEALPPSYSLVNYRNLVSGPEGLAPIGQSAWMAVVSTLGAVVLGFVAARLAVRRGGRLGAWLEGLVAVPWAIPGTVFALALATAFSVNAPWAGRFLLVGTPWLLPLAYLIRNLPLTGRAALAGFRQLDPALEEAAAGLGAGAWRRLRRIVFPLLRPALLAGAGLAFISALGDFVVSIVLYTWSNRPISMAIDAVLRRDDLGVAAVYGTLLMLASTAAFLLWGNGEEARG